MVGYKGLSYSSPTLASAISNLMPAFTYILAIIFRYVVFSFFLYFFLLFSMGNSITLPFARQCSIQGCLISYNIISFMIKKERDIVIEPCFLLAVWFLFQYFVYFLRHPAYFLLLACRFEMTPSTYKRTLLPCTNGKNTSFREQLITISFNGSRGRGD